MVDGGGVGLRKHNTTGVVQNTYINKSSFEQTVDYVEPGDNHEFTRNLRWSTGGFINGTTTGTTGKTYVNIQPDDFRLFDDHTFRHLTDSARPSDALLVAKLLADTNPYRADVDIPTFIGELREIPELFVKEATHIKRLAGTNLKYQFGVAPLVSDVRKLLNFQDLVLKREKEFKSLYDKGLTRTHTLYKSDISDSRTDTIHDRDKFLVNAFESIRSKRVVRGHVRWKPRSTPQNISAGDLRATARKAALGLTVDFNTAYQLMPWSWLVDWCSNFGDILSLSRGALSVDYEDLTLIEEVESTATFTVTNPHASGGTWYHKTYTRAPQSGFSFDFQLPHLSLRQVSILGSIGVTRRVPRSF